MYKENDSIIGLLSRTDDAMYLSKKAGKNEVTFN